MGTKLKETVWVLACLLLTQRTLAQVTDNFSDGDFTTNPVWSGETTKFEVLAEQLHLNDTDATGEAYLSTSSQAIANAEWNFYVEISENPTSANFTSVYLVSDQANLADDLSGYFVKIGNTSDEVSLYRQDGSTETEIIDGLDDRVDTKPVQIEIKVTRDTNGNWELSSRPIGEISFVIEGSVMDDTHTVSNYFGVHCKYTATRSDAFYFDNILITGTPQPDTRKPFVTDLSAPSNNQLNLQFSEAVNTAVAETTTNYVLNGHAITAASLAGNEVALSVNSALANATDYTLTVRNIQDEAGNVLTDTTLNFFYFEPVSAQRNDVIISELMPDPNPVKADLPDAEFVEIYNRSGNPFDLQDLSLNDKLLPPYILRPQQFVVLCASADSASLAPFGQVIGLDSWPTLPNSGTRLVLRNATSMVIDSLAYSATEVVGGTSLERISETTPCDQRINLALSLAERGGTPGETNTIISQKDTHAPRLLSIQPRNDTLKLFFDERVADESLQTELIQIQPEQTVAQIVRDAIDEKILYVLLAEPLVTNTTYSLTFANTQDCYGNISPSQTASFYFDNEPPTLLRAVVRDTAEVALIFSEKVATQLIEDEDNYWLDSVSNTPRFAIIGQDSASVLLRFLVSLADGQNHQLTLTRWEDSYGNPGDTLTVNLRYQQDIDTVLVESEYQLEVHLSEPILPESVSEVMNYEIDRRVGHPQAAFIDRSHPNVIHLILANPLSENREHELRIDLLQDEQNGVLSTPAYRFYFDRRSPGVDSVVAITERTLLVYFDEKVDSLTATNALHYQLSDYKVEQVELKGNRQVAHLQLDTALVPEVAYELEIVGIADLSGNIITSPKGKSFVYDQRPPALLSGKMVNPFELRLYFSEAVQTVSVNNFQLETIGSPDSVWVSRLRAGEVRLFFAEPLPTEEITLTATSITDLRGNRQPEPLRTTINNTQTTLGQIIVLSPTDLQLSFTQGIDETVMLNFTQYLVNEVYSPTEVTAIGRRPYAVHLTFDRPLQADVNYQLTISELVNDEGQRVIGVQDSFIYQTQIEHIEAEERALLLHFQVPLDSSLAVQLMHYQLGQTHPAAAIWVGEQTIRLVFEESLEPLTRYEFLLSGLKDIDGDVIPASTHTVGLGRTPNFNELLITEIMADPTPAVGLPEVEYLELYNASDELLSTNGLRLADAMSSTLLRSALLLPGEYLIVSANADQPKLASRGRTMGITSFPSLNSSGDQLSITDAYGSEVFSVSYSDDWYNDAEKKQGGWSLEMIDYTHPCGEQDNWTASVDENGGTPGRVNSVNQSNPDNQAPVLQTAFAESATEVALLFSEKLDPSSFEDGQISISSEVTVDTIVWKSDRKSATAHLIDSLQTQVAYTIRANQLYDCSGNLIDDQAVSLVLSEEATMGDVLLSELLFYPRSGGVRFVEIYNHSDKPINLKDWQLANSEGDSLANLSVITTENYQLNPQQYLALTEDATTLVGDYPSASEGNILVVDALPSLPSGAGNVALHSLSGERMQFLIYDEDWHHPILEDKRGVSLERIQWSAPVNDRNNWQSAAQTVGFATPGYVNSQLSTVSPIPAALSVEPRVFTPDQDGFQDYTQILYRWPNAGNVANVIVFDSQGQKVKHLARNTTLAEEGFLRWDGTDDAGQQLATGYYIIYFEVFHTNGQVSGLKERVVLGRPF
ncbi:lamin tail domain-containing protein [Tunicatimonas pelagia]|uniref:lamin tail domain-containing protein n=1 Tax=Tunicatimonas pelagia TaxID=931531 RepID=UPI0026659E6B|nr:lamin tail domain-containing protein [Tunicatimonas pelagia]WKN41654.1 lamin tail domain-containing protein [Tunicatimonas pelagia]